MSQAFVKERDDNVLLHQIKPTIPSLVNYIKIEPVVRLRSEGMF